VNSEGFTTVTAQNTVFRDVTPCSWVHVYRFFEQSATAIFTAGDTVSSVGTATGNWLDNTDFDSRQGHGIFLLSKTSRQALEPNHTPNQWVPGVFYPLPRAGVKWPGHVVDHSFSTYCPGKKMSGPITLFPLYAFMECTGTTLPFYPEDGDSRFLWNVQTTRRHIPVKTSWSLPPATIPNLATNIAVIVSPLHNNPIKPQPPPTTTQTLLHQYWAFFNLWRCGHACKIQQA
jgi:hypothetical protein